MPSSNETDDLNNRVTSALSKVFNERISAFENKVLGELENLRDEVNHLRQMILDDDKPFSTQVMEQQRLIATELIRKIQQGAVSITPIVPKSVDPKSVHTPIAPKALASEGDQSKLKDGSWYCSNCHAKDTFSQSIREAPRNETEQSSAKNSPSLAKSMFHDTILHGLYLSPEAFIYHETPSNNATPRTFRWSIEHQSYMNPANIDESKVHEQNSSLFETADNHKIQQIASEYFKMRNHPSPIPQVRPRHIFSSPAVLHRDQPMESSP